MIRATNLAARALALALPMAVSAQAASAQEDIVAQLREAAQFSTFASLIEAAGLVEELKDAGPYTVLAPTDQAFNRLPQGALDRLRQGQNRGQLEDLIRHHIILGEAYPSDELPEQLRPMEGRPVGIGVTGTGAVLKPGGGQQQVDIVAGDIAADNGIIHGIGSVLVPQQLAQALQSGQQQSQEQRRPQQAGGLPVDPADIVVPEGYQIEAVASGLNYPSDIAFDDRGAMYVTEAGGHTYGTRPEQAPPARILRVHPDGNTEVVFDDVVPLQAIRQAETSEDMPEGLIPPITGLTWHDGRLYVTHRTRVSTLDPQTGELKTIINGMPSWGEFLNHKAIFGPDGKMYFVLSTQGNSGPVDEHMMKVMDIFGKPDAHEVPCEDVTLTGQNYTMDNKLTEEEGDTVVLGVYVPPGVRTEYGQVIEGQSWCHGTMYRANPDGTNIERVAWGLRSNYGYGFAPDGRLIATQNSGNIMQPRPIYDDWEPVYEIREGTWYGWPDYYSSVPITDPRFTKPDDPEFKGEPFPHDFALTRGTHEKLLGDLDAPPAPLVKLPVHSAAEGMVFGREEFGIPEDQILVAEFGAIIPYYKDPEEWPGFRVQRVNLQTGEIWDFLINKSGKPAWAADSGGLRRPIQVAWGPDGALYVVDFGVIEFSEKGMSARPNTGVIWKVTQTGQQ